MSNKCPHCGAAAGKSHDPCPYGPGGKYSNSKEPKPVRAPPPKVEEVKAVAAAALNQIREKQEVKKQARQIAKVAVENFDGAIQPADGIGGIAPSHPDCPRCAQVKEQTRDRVRRAREKKV